MSVTKRVRFEVLRRDNHACRYCGGAAPQVRLTVDHVVPTALGGSDDPANLVAACVECNSGKSSIAPDSALVADVAAEALRWAWAMEQAAEIRRGELAQQQDTVAEFDDAWCAYVAVPAGHTMENLPAELREPLPREMGWRDSVIRFLALGLDMDYLRYAVETAMNKSDVTTSNIWRYFCGMCWRELERHQALAQQLLAEPAAAAGDAPVTARDGRTTLGREIDHLLAEGLPARVLPACVQEWVAREAPPEHFAPIADEVVNHDAAGRWFGGEIVPPPRTSLREPQAFGDVIGELFQAWTPEPAT